MVVVISLKDVWKVYTMGTVHVAALRGLTVDIKKGEFVSIMGPSGSGKSTSMNMIGCLDVPTKGHIYLYGKDIAHLHESDLAQIRGKRIGFVFQKFNLISSLTALENVTLPMMFQNVSPEQAEARGKELLAKVGLADRMHHRPNELSGGQQQRVSISRALANDPEIILADEPTGNLDSASGKLVLDVLETLHKKDGKTLILVTHDPALGRRADRMCVLKDGQVLKIEQLKRHV
ncbi:ABC transporter ATP-binding protein [Candidatus Woesearchaeota archaeon]|nr:ABC transporter ATP-binding protein [Candidatus Woesearchaeota archaeon]